MEGREADVCYVHPDDGGTHGAAVFVETDERLALVRQADRFDVRGVDRLQRPADGGGRGTPPVLGVLLVPARPRERERELGAALGDRTTFSVPHYGFRGGGRRVDADDVGHAANLRLSDLAAELLVLCQVWGRVGALAGEPFLRLQEMRLYGNVLVEPTRSRLLAARAP